MCAGRASVGSIGLCLGIFVGIKKSEYCTGHPMVGNGRKNHIPNRQNRNDPVIGWGKEARIQRKQDKIDYLPDEITSAICDTIG